MDNINPTEEEKLTALLEEGCWITCKVDGANLKMAKMKRENVAPHNTNSLDEENFFVPDWLNASDNPEQPECIPIPLCENEKFYFGTFDQGLINNSFVPEVNISLTSDEFTAVEEGKSYERTYGTIVPLFISHILSSREHQGQFTFANITFKKVMIFGIVVDVSSLTRKDLIRVDDGTGQIKCFFQEYVNEKKFGDNYDSHTTDKSLSKINQMLTVMLKEYQSRLPTFEDIKVGDRVCLSGDVSFYKENFYIFIDKLERMKDVQAHCAFMKRVFNLYEKEIVVPT